MDKGKLKNREFTIFADSASPTDKTHPETVLDFVVRFTYHTRYKNNPRNGGNAYCGAVIKCINLT